jgi:hypothetical protein
MFAALAWYGYVASVAGAIVLLGGAIQYAYGGSRFVLGLTGRSRQRRRQKGHALPRERRTRRPNEDQIRLLKAVYEHFRSEGKRSRFDYIVWMLDKEEIDAREAAETMPTGLLTPDPQARGGFFYDEDELMVTLHGLRYCENGMDTLDLLARVLAHFAERVRTAEPSTPGTAPQVTITADEVRDALGLSAVELDTTRALVDQYEPRVWMTAQHGESWSFQINASAIRRYRGIRDGAEYLRARTG